MSVNLKNALGQRDPDTQKGTDGIYVVMAFIAFTLMTLIGSNVWLAWRGYEKELGLARESTRNLAHAVSLQFDGVFSDVDRTLENIAFRIEQGDMSTQAIEALQPELVNTLSRSEHLHSLFVFDKHGRSIVDTQPDRRPNISNADRPYFLAHIESPSTLTLISAPVPSRYSSTWIIPVTRRLNDPEGAFSGVVLAAIKVAYVRNVLEGFAIGEKGAVALSLADGTILVRRPFEISDLGRNVATPYITSGLKNFRVGSTRMVSPVDGVMRVLGFEFTQNHPVVVAVARAESEILRNWWRSLTVQSITVVVLSILIAVFGRFVIHMIRLRSQERQEIERAHQQVSEANLRLQHLASHDGLTDLLNRRAFDSRAAALLATSARHRRSLSVILLDVDHFKAYNDHFGHQPGDECLRLVASALQSAAKRPGDVVARYGGEEFIMMLPETDADGARFIAAKAIEAVRALRIDHPRSPLGIVTISAGGTSTQFEHSQALTLAELIERADSALYEVKNAGRNGYRDYREPR